MFVVQCDFTASLKEKDQNWQTVGEAYDAYKDGCEALSKTSPYSKYGYRLAEINEAGEVVLSGSELVRRYENG